MFACPLFHEFRDLEKFAKIMDREYLKKHITVIQQVKSAKIKGAKIIS